VASLTLKLPDKLKEQAEEAAEEKGYQSTSEYARQALREKVETDLVVVRDREEMITVEDAREILRKDAAVSKLESKVEEDGIPEVWEPGETWKPVLEEIHEELVEEDLIPDDTSLRKIYEYTQESREQLLEQEDRGESQ
jgi:Arc/MetJ-type ribon-helix-helix transcriptional regulator